MTVESLKSAHDAVRIIDTAAPYTTAKLFLDQFVAPDKTRTIHHHRGAFYRWKENAYPEIVDTELRRNSTIFSTEASSSKAARRSV